MKFLLLFLFFLPQISWAGPHTLVIVGDSITEGYGITREDAFPALLEAKLKAAGKDWKVANMGVSGSTSASGPGRVKWALKGKPDALFLALGANDGLRGLDPGEMEKNLSQAISLARAGSAKVFLSGIQVPPNYGAEYSKKFRDVFPRVAKKEKVTLFPFLLEGVAGADKLNLQDRIHPNEAGHKIIAENLFQFLKDKL